MSPLASRLRARSAKSKTESKFDKLRRLRETGESAISLYKDNNGNDDDDAMYMQVDEAEYQRLMNKHGGSVDDFVIDDEGLGYGDNGTDDIGVSRYSSDDDNGTRNRTTRKPSKRPSKPTSRDTPPPSSSKRSIGSMFKSSNLRKRTDQPAKQSTQDDEEFMSSLISGLEAGIPTTPSKSSTLSKRRLTSTPSTAPYSARKRHTPYSVQRPPSAVKSSQKAVGVMDISDPSLDPFGPPPHKKHRTTDFSALSPAAAASVTSNSFMNAIKAETNNDDAVPDNTIKSEDAANQDFAMIEAGNTDEEMKPEIKSETEPKIKTEDEDVPLYATTDEQTGKNWMDIQSEIMMRNSGEDTKSDVLMKTTSDLPAVETSTESSISTDILIMYWLDAMEKNGIVYLFGKTKRVDSDRYESCCVRITNIERNVFLLPQVNPESGERYPALTVFKEFERKAVQLGIKKFGCKPVERKYAFEVPNIPSTAEYLKVVYGFDQPQLPADLRGDTFDHTFGTTYSALELFLLKRRMMGPCWLTINGATRVSSHDKLSWCRQEFDTAKPKEIAVLTDDEIESLKLPRVPLFTTMTLSLKTVMNHREGTNEVVAISAIVHRDLRLDDSTPASKRPAEQFTVVRQLTGIPFPADFMRAVEAQSRRGMPVEVTRTEAALLNYFTALIYRIDPDVVAAHNFLGFDLDVLLHRMKALRSDGWSRLGRMRRTVWPKLQAGAGGMGESSFGERQVMAGRVVCDTYMTSKDLIKAKSFSLTNLVLQELEITREEISFERIPEYFSSSTQLLHFLRHTAFDAFLAASLMIHLQALPLTKQLTNLAGNLWSRTLMGARAERNEFLLLHEFYRNKFIRPDKFFGASQPSRTKNNSSENSLKAEIAEAAATADENTEDAAAGANDGDEPDTAASAQAPSSGRRKPAYLGGLVLEPKKGFYDRFVLLLDFNSLYPSIIQEFNICFTTVQRPPSNDTIPDPPSPDLPPGILPRLLKTLVERRKQVKQLLKQKNLSSAEAEQLDVRQRALKLTANSMYGCLGFTHSRFYAKPLAMLITSRGRDILQSTRDLALSEGLEVIYGDTDSIMIATQTDVLADIYELGAQFKRRVNESYKLLELDIDGVFKRLLLLKKKKYAALQIVQGKDGGYTTKLESKGLDLVRRDWCELSHDVSDYTLKQLFSDSNDSSSMKPETESAERGERDESAVIAAIHEHLVKVGRAVRSNQVPIDRYIIHKGLTKPPENYADKKSQPHVLVALQMREKGIAVRSGDTIPYIIVDSKCMQLADSSSGSVATGSYAERARHPDEIKQSGGQLYPDAEWYLNQQVLPPCARLLDPLEGTDISTLAQCLGLDASKYRNMSISSSNDNDSSGLRTLDSQISDEERFKLADKFVTTCRECKFEYEVSGIARICLEQNASSSGTRSKDKMLECGLGCPKCSFLPPPGSLATQLMLQIRKHIRKYYEFAMVCDEPSCGLVTRTLSVTGAKCQRSRCSGRLQPIYSDKLLYYQLLYYSSLFNVEKSSVRLEVPAGDVQMIFDRHAEHITKLAVAVESYLSVSARRFVDLSSLFSFCKV